jgi:hypothetical protein
MGFSLPSNALLITCRLQEMGCVSSGNIKVCLDSPSTRCIGRWVIWTRVDFSRNSNNRYDLRNCYSWSKQNETIVLQ